MKRSILFLLISVSTFVPLLALDGIVVTVNGKVETQDKTGSWRTLSAGDSLASGSMISTGFKSEATVKLGASILTIKPLTRMTLTQLVEKEDTVDTELYLEVGNVKAEVNSLNNKKNGFTVKSPVATASVRGTVFEIGENLVIIDGTVVFTSPVGQTRRGQAGQQLELVGEAVAGPTLALQQQMETLVLNSTPSSEVRSPVRSTSSTSFISTKPKISSNIPILNSSFNSSATVVIAIE